MIAFVGSVFSPYYALGRRRGDAVATNHCAVNVALYGERDRWSMTERGSGALYRDESRLGIGRSEWRADDGCELTIRLDEVTAPWPSRVRGVVRLRSDRWFERSFALDAAGRHRWRPIAPHARVDVELDAPKLRWSGIGYFDANAGDAPLEADFVRWDWSRARLPGQRSGVLYDVLRRDGTQMTLALEFDAASGTQRAFAAPPRVELPRSRWRIARGTRSDDPFATRVRRTLEDGPFYARSLIDTHLLGQRCVALHESLSLERFGKRWVQALLPFRMPRAFASGG